MDTVLQTIHSRTISTPWGVYYIGSHSSGQYNHILTTFITVTVQPGTHSHLGEVRHWGVQALPKDLSRSHKCECTTSHIQVQHVTSGPRLSSPIKSVLFDKLPLSAAISLSYLFLSYIFWGFISNNNIYIYIYIYIYIVFVKYINIYQ